MELIKEEEPQLRSSAHGAATSILGLRPLTRPLPETNSRLAADAAARRYAPVAHPLKSRDLYITEQHSCITDTDAASFTAA